MCISHLANEKFFYNRKRFDSVVGRRSANLDIFFPFIRTGRCDFVCIIKCRWDVSTSSATAGNCKLFQGLISCGLFAPFHLLHMHSECLSDYNDAISTMWLNFIDINLNFLNVSPSNVKCISPSVRCAAIACHSESEWTLSHVRVGQSQSAKW